MPNADAEKAMALVRKALSSHSVEESRTCALTAVQLIVKYKLQLVDPNDLPKPPEPKKPKSRQGAGGSPPQRRPHAGFPPRAPSRMSFNTTCMLCDKPIYAGTEAFWMAAFNKAACPHCFESEIMGSEGWNGGRY
jgi:hypothetical protein